MGEVPNFGICANGTTIVNYSGVVSEKIQAILIFLEDGIDCIIRARLLESAQLSFCFPPFVSIKRGG